MSGTASILVVDDDEDARSALRELFEPYGLSVVDAANGQAALDLLVHGNGRTPSLVILDIEMPRVSGWELLKLMKSYYRLSSIPVIVLSAYPQDIATHDPVDACFQKPCDPAELMKTVAALTARA